MPAEVLVAFVTCPPDKADEIARGLIEDRVAACVNVVPAVQSVYRWQGAVQADREALLVIKTVRGRFEALKQAVLARHPYELPEVVALPVAHGHVPYLEWVAQATAPA